MKIQGVNGLEVKNLKSIRVQLDPKFTNGHDFCEMIIDETNNRFTAILYGGESYTHCWGSPGKDFIQFLINVFRNDPSYLYGKICDRSKENWLDVERTTTTMKERLFEMRKDGDISEEDAREVYDRLEDMFNGEDKTSWDFFYMQYFDGIIDKAFGPEPFNDNFMVSTSDRECSVFCHKVAPILAEVLHQEYSVKEVAV